MTDPTIVTDPDPPANLAAMLVEQIRYRRRLQLHVQYAREQRKALRVALAEAVTMIGTLSRQVDRARQNSADRAEHNRVLLAEIKTLKAEITRLQRQVIGSDNLSEKATSYAAGVQ